MWNGGTSVFPVEVSSTTRLQVSRMHPPHYGGYAHVGQHAPPGRDEDKVVGVHARSTNIYMTSLLEAPNAREFFYLQQNEGPAR